MSWPVMNSDPATVKTAITGLLKHLNDAVIEDIRQDRVDNSRFIISMLQVIVSDFMSSAGYKCFVDIKEVDTRLLLITADSNG